MLRKVRNRLRTFRTRTNNANVGTVDASTSTSPQRMWTFGRRRERDPESISGATSRMDSAGSPMRSSSPNRSARIADKLKLARRSRALGPAEENPGNEISTAVRAPKRRMLPPPPASEGFSIRKTSEISVPSSHVSNDAFLNDSVPVDPIAPEDKLHNDNQNKNKDPLNHQYPDGDNYRLKRASDADNDFPPSSPPVQARLKRNLSTNIGPNAPNSLLDGLSAPPSYGANSPRRSTVWKAEPDHSHTLARNASMAVTHEERVDAAHALAAAAEKQATDLEQAVSCLKSSVDAVREEARLLPSTRMPRYEALMFANGSAGGDDERSYSFNHNNNEARARHESQSDDNGHARSLRDLGWCEKVWDIEAMLAERRLDAAVTAIEALLRNDHDHSFEQNNQAIPSRVASLVDEISQLLVARSPFDCAEKAKEHAQLLVRLGKADLGCTVIERTAEDLFHAKLSRLQPASEIDLARYVNTVLQLTCASLEETHTALASIPLDDVSRAERIVAWSTCQTDKVYRAFIRSCISHTRGLDGGALLQIVSAIHARSAIDTSGDNGAYPPFSGAAAALFRARLLSNLRAHLRDIAHDTREALGRFTLSEDSASWPPREAQTLARSLDAVASVVAPVLKELPALDEGEFDGVFTYVIVTYAAGSTPEISDTNNSNDAQILAFVGKSITNSMKKHNMCAPRTIKAAEWLVSGNNERIAQEVIRIAANSEASRDEGIRGSVGVTKLSMHNNGNEDNGINHHSHGLRDEAHALGPLANETVLREKARQMLRASATVAVA